MAESSRWTSVRMRASRDGRHVSGAERLVPFADAAATVAALLGRATAADPASRVVLSLAEVPPSDIVHVRALPVQTVEVANHDEGQRLAVAALGALGVSPCACRRALGLLNAGPNPSGGNMRGAVLMDHLTGDRLELDSERGVRVSRVDMPPEGRAQMLADGGGPRRLDAIILASKVATVPCAVADLGWSDDPTYVAGYVASASCGYVRYSVLKRRGSPHGGRVYFVRRAAFDLTRDVRTLERQPTLVMLDSATHDVSGPATPAGSGGNPTPVRVK